MGKLNSKTAKKLLGEAFSKTAVWTAVAEAAYMTAYGENEALVSALLAYAEFHAKHFGRRDVGIASFPPTVHEPFATTGVFYDVFEEGNARWLMEELRGYESFLEKPEMVSKVRLGAFLWTKDVAHLKPGPGAFLDAVVAKARSLSGNRNG